MFSRHVGRSGLVAAALGCLLLVLSACSKQGEGERCDRQANENGDCETGLECKSGKDVDRCCPFVGISSDERCRNLNTGGPSSTGGASSSGGSSATGGGIASGGLNSSGGEVSSSGGSTGEAGSPAAAEGGSTSTPNEEGSGGTASGGAG